MTTALVFVHSPLLGPESWAPVGGTLVQLGWTIAVPELRDDGNAPYWQQHVESVAGDLRMGTDRVVLIAHSGAGPLLGALARDLRERVAALIFVDAGLPGDGESRLGMLRAEMGDRFADNFRSHLESGGRYPEWSDADLGALVDDAATRASIVESQRPRPLEFWTEAIAAPAGWEQLPCAYLQLSAGYANPAGRAEEPGWPVIERVSNHFAILTDPGQAAEDLQSLLGRLGVER